MAELGSGAGSSYPASLDNDNSQEINHPNAARTKARAEVPNDLAAAIVAIETELGTDPAGTKTDVKTYLQIEHNTDATHKVTLVGMLAGTQSFTGAKTFSEQTAFSKTVKLAKGADVASASALTLGTDGNSFDITGTTGITSIGSLGVGTVVILHFDSALTLTHHITDLILPGAVNLTVEAGTDFIFHEYAAGDWILIGGNRIYTGFVSAGAITPATLSRNATPEVWDDFLLPYLVGWQTHNVTSMDTGSYGRSGFYLLGPATAETERHGISNLTNNAFAISGGNTLTAEFRVKLSGVVAAYYYFGLMDQDDLTGNGIIFAADGVAAIKAKCMAAAALTSVDTGLTWTANTTYKFKIVATASQVLFYVDDVLKATITTNIPTATLSIVAFIRGSVTACAVDYVQCTSSARV